METKSLHALRIDRTQPPRRSIGATLVVGVVILLLLAGGVGWWVMNPGPTRVRTAVAVESSAAADRTLLNASGYVTARRAATVSSKVTGKVVEVLVEEGKTVEAEQVLARLDDVNIQRSFALAQAQLEAAQSALGETQANILQDKREELRIEELFNSRAATQIELDRARTATRALEARLLSQKADVEVTQRQLAMVKQDLDDTIIRAPFAGVVTSKNAQPGEMISPMSSGGFTRTGICTIVDMSSLEIEVDVGESYINRVQPGRPVVAVLDSYPGVNFPAHVIAIIPTADRQKATVKVRVGFNKLDNRILPDMSVKVAFQSEATPQTQPAGPTITVPATAVVERDGKSIVWVVSDSKVERRAVTVGKTRDDTVVISGGLRGGERVVLDPPDTLADGAAVKEEK